MVSKYPKVCNLCGGKVEFISNDALYGRRYGSGFAYLCTRCGAYVGTHNKGYKREALGILANKEMRDWKMKCHALFDAQYQGKRTTRSDCYFRLSKALKIDPKECHFGYFDIPMLKRAYELLDTYSKVKDRMDSAWKENPRKFEKARQRLIQNMFDPTACEEALRFISENEIEGVWVQ